MNMLQGRTAFDFFSEVTDSYGILGLLIVAGIFFGGWFFVHVHADIGDQIVVWGLFRYTKRRKAIPLRYYVSLLLTLLVAIGGGLLIDNGIALFQKNRTLPFSEDLIAYYPFNGNMQNDHNDRYHGTSYGGNFVADRAKKAERAYRLNENNAYDYIELADTSALHLTAGFTLSAWVKYDNYDFGEERPIIAKHQPGNSNGFFLEIFQGGFPTVYIGGNPTLRLVSDAPKGDETWHHLAGTWDGTTLALYIDGEFHKAAQTAHIRTNATTVKIGSFVGASNGNFTGDIDEVRIYGRPLPLEVIRELYQKTK